METSGLDLCPRPTPRGARRVLALLFATYCSFCNPVVAAFSLSRKFWTTSLPSKQGGACWHRTSSRLRLFATMDEQDETSLSTSSIMMTMDNDSTTDTDSLSHWLSSPERYAAQLNVTVDQMYQAKHAHQEAWQALHQTLADLDRQQTTTSSTSQTGRQQQSKQKHQLICQHRYRYGKHPFVCHSCWMYRPVCLCRDARVTSPRLSLPAPVEQLVLWTHHKEWTSVSNSGSLLPLKLTNTQMLMKGLPAHDDAMHHLLTRNDTQLVVLWPDNQFVKQSESVSLARRTVTLSDISALREAHAARWNDNSNTQTTRSAKATPRNVTLILLEGTWRTARRMAAKLPDHVWRLALHPEDIFWRNDDTSAYCHDQSILAPLRHQDGGDASNLCTAEAAAATLVALGMTRSEGYQILDLIERKVNLIRRYRGKPMKL